MIENNIENEVIIKIKKNGSIMLPEKIKKQIKLNGKDYYRIIVCDNNILMRKMDCVFCEENDSKMVKFKGKLICSKCLKDNMQL